MHPRVHLWEFTYRDDDPIYCFTTFMTAKNTIRIRDQIHGAGGLLQPWYLSAGLQRAMGAWTGPLGQVLPQFLDPSQQGSKVYQINYEKQYAD